MRDVFVREGGAAICEKMAKWHFVNKREGLIPVMRMCMKRHEEYSHCPPKQQAQ